MKRLRQSLAWGALAAIVCAGAAQAQSCDEHNPASPAATGQINLSASDSTNDRRDELRSFVVTGSTGPVTAKIVAASPPGIVGSVSATPEVSRYSPHFGEQLKGIDIHVRLKHGDRGAVVSVSLRQVCAQYFRDSFLY